MKYNKLSTDIALEKKLFPYSLLTYADVNNVFNYIINYRNKCYPDYYLLYYQDYDYTKYYFEIREYTKTSVGRYELSIINGKCHFCFTKNNQIQRVLIDNVEFITARILFDILKLDINKYNKKYIKKIS